MDRRGERANYHSNLVQNILNTYPPLIQRVSYNLMGNSVVSKYISSYRNYIPNKSNMYKYIFSQDRKYKVFLGQCANVII